MKKYPTPYSELNEVIEILATGSRQILGDNFVGAYLQGSFATGGFDEHSDADFIIVINDDLSTQTIQNLQTMHREIFDVCNSWGQHLEGSYLPQSLLRTPFDVEQNLWYLDHGSRTFERSTHDNTLVVRSVLRRHGVTVLGPDPLDLIDPVDTGELRREIRKTMIDWGNEIKKSPNLIRSHFFQSFAVLNYCRAFHDFQAGSINSKRVGTEWAKQTVDSEWCDLIDRSWSGRPDPELSSRRDADPFDFQRTIEFIEYIVKQIEGL